MADIRHELEEEPSNFIEMDVSGREEEEEELEKLENPTQPGPESEANPAQGSQVFISIPRTTNYDDMRVETDRIKSPSEELERPSLGDLQRARPPRGSNISLKPPEPPKSSYYVGPPTATTSAYGTDPIGTIGLHHSREIIRVERDYEHGELCQFSSAFPLELEGRLTPTQFLETINSINEILISAHSVKAAAIDNTFTIMTLYLALLFRKTHYQKEMERLHRLFDQINNGLLHSRGLRMLWPRRVGFLFLEIEFY